MSATSKGSPVKACKDCRHYRLGWLDKLLGMAATRAECMAADPEYDKVTGETFVPLRRCWMMRQLGRPCGPEAKLWGPF